MPLIPTKRNLIVKVASILALTALVAVLVVGALTRPTSNAQAAASFQPSRGNTTLLDRAQPGHRLGGTAGARTGVAAATWRELPHFPPTSRSLQTNPAAPVVGTVAGPLSSVKGGGGSDPAFNGLASLDNKNLGNPIWTRPDQGLCVGYDPIVPGRPEVVFEMINAVIGEYLPTGAPVDNGLVNKIGTSMGKPGYKIPLVLFFASAHASGDPRCVFDPSSQYFYFTVTDDFFGCAFSGATSHCFVTLVVFNTTTGALHEYALDLTDPGIAGCPCFPDQPRLGFDSNAICIADDSYPAGIYGPGVFPLDPLYNGSELECFRKGDVLAGVPTPLSFSYHKLSQVVWGLGVVPVLGLMPAITVTLASLTTCEWLANDFAYDGMGNNNPSSTLLGIWKWCWGPPPSPTLMTWLVPSERYAFPVAAAQPPGGTSPTLNPDDDRIGQLEDRHSVLYTTIETALKTSSGTLDGVAWFNIAAPPAGTPFVSAQGYRAVAGVYLIYPSMWCNGTTAALVFTATSSALNPSAAYATGPCAGPFGFPAIPPGGKGTGPLDGLNDNWGDYSFAAGDPNAIGGGTTIWLATEYIPPVEFQYAPENWGTFIFTSP
jgi:hypothetical protein